MAQATFTMNMSANDRRRVGKYLMAHIFEIYKETRRRTVHIAYNKAAQIAKKAVQTFYNEYPLNREKKMAYHRTFDLENAYQVGIRDGYELVFEIGSDLMEHKHHQENDLVYWVAFENGFHGGFPHNGSMYWRTPIPEFTEWYPTPAPFTQPSPKAYILREWEQFAKTTYKQAQLNEFRRLLEETKMRLGV